MTKKPVAVPVEQPDTTPAEQTAADPAEADITTDQPDTTPAEQATEAGTSVTASAPGTRRIRMCLYLQEGERHLAPGQVVDLPVARANSLIDYRYAVPVDDQDEGGRDIAAG